MFAFERKILAVKSTDEFYTMMATITGELFENGLGMNPNDFIDSIYEMEPFPFVRLHEIRNNYCDQFVPIIDNRISLNQFKKCLLNLLNDSMSKFRFDDEDYDQEGSDDCGGQEGVNIEDKIMLWNWFLNNKKNFKVKLVTSINSRNENRFMITDDRCADDLLDRLDRSKSNENIGSVLLNSGERFFQIITKQLIRNCERIRNQYEINADYQEEEKMERKNRREEKATGTRRYDNLSNIKSFDVQSLTKQFRKLRQRQQQVQEMMCKGEESEKERERANQIAYIFVSFFLSN